MTNIDPQTIAVSLAGRSYDIVIGPGLLGQAGALIGPMLARPRTVIVTDTNVAQHHLAGLESSLRSADINVTSIEIPPGESSKSYAGLQNLLDQFFDAKVERNDTVIALGGGVVGDLVGFAAAIYRRGIDFIQIPTSLLAQVDSSVGGKTAINTRQGKNLVGAFHQPRFVLADTQTLNTLPVRELRSGYAEIVKYGAIGDRAFFDWLRDNGKAMLEGDGQARQYAIATSCQHKATIVAADERESGQRALLNLGHTFGHALEAETGFSDRLTHGEAVAVGMGLAFDLSALVAGCPPSDVSAIKEHLASSGLPSVLEDIPGAPLNTDHLLAHMEQDKKVADGQLTFVVARAIGEAFLTSDIPLQDVASVLKGAR